MNAAAPRADLVRHGPVELYRYGPLAWFWRVLLAFGVALGGLFAVLAARGGEPVLWIGAAALLVPVAFLGVAVATRVVHDGATLHVATLLGCRRRIPLARLGRATLRRHAEGTVGPIHAPRLWQRVHGALPVYLDLLATIPDPEAFVAVFGVRPGQRMS